MAGIHQRRRRRDSPDNSSGRAFVGRRRSTSPGTARGLIHRNVLNTEFSRLSARRDAVRFSNGSLRAEECRALMTEMMKVFGCRPTQAARLGMGPAYGNAHA